MTTQNTTVLKVVQIILLDAVVGLFVGLLVFEKINRWPILLVIVPLLLFFNIKYFWRTQENRRLSMRLPLVYGTGLVYAVLWTLFRFEWWKLLIIPIPLLFMIYFLQRARHPARGDVATEHK